MTEALLTMPPEGTPILVRAGKRISSLARRDSVVTAAALLVASWPVHAQQGGPPLLRDAETEQLLRDYTRPILRAAGLEKQNIQVVIINDLTFNAFVADGRRIFVNYGALRESDTPNQIIGVLAHETGHLAGGHLAKLREQVSRAQTQLIIALLGPGRCRRRRAGCRKRRAAAVAAPQAAIMRTMLSYQRQQEENADKAGVKFLNATGQSARGMYETFKRFSEQSLYAAAGADPYNMSHPMPAERVRRWRNWPDRVRIGTRRTIRPCSFVTT
jgi:predicted Zn-dependent protease